jgi:transcriptional repressor NrdR
MVLERLRGLDDVAYIRFASVYKDFQSIEEFEDALKGLE